MKLLLIGQAPNKTGLGPPLAGRCGARLASLAGISLDEFLARTERINLFAEFPGKDGKGDAFPLDEARRLAVEFVACRLADKSPTVLLGGNVAAAFNVSGRGFFNWMPAFGRPFVAVAPHPSGISRWWNEPANLERARAFWSELFPRSL